MLEPKELLLTDTSGKLRTFILHKFPATIGREIITQYPTSNIPKVAEYKQSEEIMLKLMAHVAVVGPEGGQVMLTTRALVDNHVGDAETLMKVEWAMMEYNFSFFKTGLSSAFLESISQKAASWIFQTLIPSLAPLFLAAKQASKTSKPN